MELADAVQKATSLQTNFKFLYDVSLPIEAKIEAICKEIYRADGIQLSGTFIIKLLVMLVFYGDHHLLNILTG